MANVYPGSVQLQTWWRCNSCVHSSKSAPGALASAKNKTKTARCLHIDSSVYEMGLKKKNPSSVSECTHELFATVTVHSHLKITIRPFVSSSLLPLTAIKWIIIPNYNVFLVDRNSNPMRKQRWEADSTSPTLKGACTSSWTGFTVLLHTQSHGHNSCLFLHELGVNFYLWICFCIPKNIFRDGETLKPSGGKDLDPSVNLVYELRACVWTEFCHLSLSSSVGLMSCSNRLWSAPWSIEWNQAHWLQQWCV